jgi:hypothetical protein
MGANHQLRWSPRAAHLMLKVRTAVTNGALSGSCGRSARPPGRYASAGNDIFWQFFDPLCPQAAEGRQLDGFSQVERPAVHR